MASLVIGTRSSPLAVWQADWVRDLLETRGIDVRLQMIQTSGDKHRVGPLATRGGKGLFVKELETALQHGRVDLAVHSLKDVPTLLSDGFELAAFLPRADPRDCLIAGKGIVSLEDLHPGAVIGSCSPRRISQLLNRCPGVQTCDLRGNVETRLNKVRNGDLDATFLAKAGLDRLGIDDPDLIHPLEPETLLPAAGQGIVAIEILSARDDLKVILKDLNDPVSEKAALAERSLVRHLEGTCASPIGAFARIEGEHLSLSACVGDPGGVKLLKENCEGNWEKAEDLGYNLAQRLNSLGAQDLIHG